MQQELARQDIADEEFLNTPSGLTMTQTTGAATELAACLVERRSRFATPTGGAMSSISALS